ncbi:MAG: cation-translocating P-type ATPase [Lachnospiraceae bacterium]|nr:cation-translocating P-type ATPase [Lachnospiraceae bacterium]
MIKRMNDFLEGLPMTVVGGVFLIMSFVFPRTDFVLPGNVLPFDPAWVTVIICGIPLLYLAVWRVIYNKGISKISSALLISIAMIAAIAIGDLFAAGEVAFIMEIGAILEDMTTNRAKKGLKKLISLAPTQGRRITDDKSINGKSINGKSINGLEEMIPAEQIRQNDVLRVLPGETIPVDGIIIQGETSIDQSIMTGESLPVDKGIGEDVFCGTINRFGSIDMRATKVGEDSSLQKLIRMVQDAENKQAPMQRIADKCASWLVPVAMMIAIITGLATQDIVRAVTVLVVFCPCALVLATPTAIMAAIGQATKHGVIIKSGEALEKMGKVNTIAFDKTGTLTYGRLEVSDIISFDKNISESELLSLTASAEAKSEHPLGKAIVAHAKEKGIVLKDSDFFQMQSGKGICAEVSGRKLYLGNEKYILQSGMTIPKNVENELEKLRVQGKASIIVADGSSCLGMLALSDVLRPEAATMAAKLSEMNTDTVLLTGDNQKTAAYFATQAGITKVKADLLPEEKVQSISEIRGQGNRVCMIGDGVNDAPALKIADVGVAMGSMGSDIAVEAADIALMSDDISKIPYLKRLSNATVATIKLSITLSMCINFIAVTCSVLGVLNPTTGALVHNAGSCFVVLVAALLYDRKFE